MIEVMLSKRHSHNRLLLSVLMVLLYPSLLLAENIPLIKKGGVYEVPVEVNGVITLNFVLDTGASEVNIPADVASTLYRAGTITDADFLPGQLYKLADGSLVKSSRFILRSLKIGKNRVANIPASIGNNASSLLLGQSFLERLGTWSMNSQRQVLVLEPMPTQDKRSLSKEGQVLSNDKTRPLEQKRQQVHDATRKVYYAIGTLYYASVGSHMGTVLLKTDSKLLKLTIGEKGTYNGFSDEHAWDKGAAWEVHYYEDEYGELRIDRAVFAGEVDHTIHIASQLVKKYFEMLVRLMYTEAYEMISQREKSYTNINSLSHGSDTLVSSSDAKFHPKCTDIKIVSQAKNKIVVQANISCLRKPDYAYYENDDNYYQCDVININGNWYLEHVHIITFKQWQK